MSDLFETANEDEGDWISVSDLMAGLMMIFLFVAVVYMRQQVLEKDQLADEKKQLAIERERALALSRTLEDRQEQVRGIAQTWEESHDAIYDALRATFEDDLPRWDAELDRDSLVIRFDAPEVLFAPQESTLKPRFEEIIADFFPRYVDVLRGFDEQIEEVRIEGHTSSEWSEESSVSDAFFENMALSQARTRAVLEYALRLSALADDRDWVMGKVTANGMSSSRLRLDDTGDEDRAASRRVEFRVRTEAEERIREVLEELLP